MSCDEDLGKVGLDVSCLNQSQLPKSLLPGCWLTFHSQPASEPRRFTSQLHWSSTGHFTGQLLSTHTVQQRNDNAKYCPCLDSQLLSPDKIYGCPVHRNIDYMVKKQLYTREAALPKENPRRPEEGCRPTSVSMSCTARSMATVMSISTQDWTKVCLWTFRGKESMYNGYITK